jgi:general secretion pathway protein D
VGMVPGLGKLPYVGNLFRYDNRKRVKTNLMVFLRPVVLRNPDASHGVTADRYDYIRLMQGDSRVSPHPLMPESTFKPSLLSPMPPAPGQAGTAPPSVSPAINEALPERWRTRPATPSSVAPSSVAPVLPGSEASPQSSAVVVSPVRGPEVIQTAPNEVVIQR